MKFKMSGTDENNTSSLAPGVLDSLSDSTLSGAAAPSDFATTAAAPDFVLDNPNASSFEAPEQAAGQSPSAPAYAASTSNEHTFNEPTSERNDAISLPPLPIATRKQSSGFVQGVLLGIVLPILAGAFYLQYANQDFKVKMPGETDVDFQLPKDTDNDQTRTPAARITIPPPLELQSKLSPEVSAATVASRSAHGSAAQGPLKIVLDSNGVMISPFSVELDENGDEVTRVEVDRHLPNIAMGEFEYVQSLKLFNLPLSPANGFTSSGPARPFAFSDAEKKRILDLRAAAPEIKDAIQHSESITVSRSQKPVCASDALDGSPADSEGFTELRWLRSASFVLDVIGEKLADKATEKVSIQKRIGETLLKWAKTYKPSGSAISDLPLLDALVAYDHVRSSFNSSEQNVIDDFFKQLVDAQFTKVKSLRNYGVEHAAHTRFAMSVGNVTGSPTYQYYGQVRYQQHLEFSPLSALESFGEKEVAEFSQLLQAALVLERAHSAAYQNPRMIRSTDLLLNRSQATPQLRLETLAVAAYFRQELYSVLPETAKLAGVSSSRFGTSEGAILAAIRKPTSSFALRVNLQGRTPTSAIPGTTNGAPASVLSRSPQIPTQLPQKQSPKPTH
jgi:hypothetical protein